MEHDKYIVALGLVSTCKPDMVIDIDDPVGMMTQVCGEFDQLRVRNAELEVQLSATDKGLLKASDPNSGWQGINRECKLWQEKAEALRAEVARLRKAIATHKNNVWGRHKVEHNEDVVLYAALEASDGKNTLP